MKTDAPGLEKSLGVKDDVAFRKASRLYELLQRRGRDPYDFSARAFRADAQLALARAEAAGMSAPPFQGGKPRGDHDPGGGAGRPARQNRASWIGA